MKEIIGFEKLLGSVDGLPDSGWIGVNKSFSTKNEIEKLTFYVPENEDEEFDIEDNYEEFLELPTFKDIVSNKLEHHPNATLKDILGAVAYYFNNDDFED